MEKRKRRNGVDIIVKKRVQNEVLGCNLKNNRMITADGDCSHEIKGRLLLERKKTLVYQTNSFVDIIEQYAFSYRINLSENIVY